MYSHVLATAPTAVLGLLIVGATVAFASVVIHEEWPAMRSGDGADQAERALDVVWRTFQAMNPQQAREVSAYQESLTRLTDLGNARRARLLANSTKLPPVLWCVLIL